MPNFLDERGLSQLVGLIDEKYMKKLNMDTYILDSGKSGEWWYIKFANGLAICGCRVEENNKQSSSTWQSNYLYQSKNIAYPFPFTGEPSGGYGVYIGSGVAFNARFIIRDENFQAVSWATAAPPTYMITYAIFLGSWK